MEFNKNISFKKLTITNQFPGCNCRCSVKILATHTVKDNRIATMQAIIAKPRSPFIPLTSEKMLNFFKLLNIEL